MKNENVLKCLFGKKAHSAFPSMFNMSWKVLYIKYIATLHLNAVTLDSECLLLMVIFSDCLNNCEVVYVID